MRVSSFCIGMVTAATLLAVVSPAQAAATGAAFNCTATNNRNDDPACKDRNGRPISVQGTGQGPSKSAAQAAARGDFVAKCSAAGGSVNAGKIKFKCTRNNGAGDNAGDVLGL